VYAAYAIGDLEPGLYEQCTWAGATRAGTMQALVLYYQGLMPPALLVMGANAGLRAILRKTLRPQQVYFTCRAQHLPLTEEVYAWQQTIAMWRMVLRPPSFRPVAGDCLRLTPADGDRLAELYRGGGGLAYAPAQLERGVFYGIEAESRLVAAAGTHLASPTYSVAAMGNVFTRPEHRGQGYASATTSAVVAELLQQGIRDIVLNVAQANQSAIRIYERLGFERHCPFVEGPATALPGRASPS
jgi:RimJ/RimL family protein N-acetyltransferase